MGQGHIPLQKELYVDAVHLGGLSLILVAGCIFVQKQGHLSFEHFCPVLIFLHFMAFERQSIAVCEKCYIAMYVKPLSAIIDSYSIIHHSFADDLQL